MNAKLVMTQRFRDTNTMCFPPELVWTKHQLFSLLGSKNTPVVTINGVTGVLNSIQREDGSGSSFNVRLVCTTTAQSKMVYVRTID